MNRILVGWFLFVAIVAPGLAAASGPATDLRPAPFERWEFDFESGLLWRAGHNGTYLNYIVQPQLLTLKGPPHARRSFAGGELVLRPRFSLLLEPISKGPETRYIGVSASGILEWWNAARTLALFFSSGGGFGGMDSKGHEIAGAQGQDLNLNWFLYPGVRCRYSDRCSGSFGIYFQHVSNGGMDKVNPGLDAVGPMLSLGWHF